MNLPPEIERHYKLKPRVVEPITDAIKRVQREGASRPYSTESQRKAAAATHAAARRESTHAPRIKREKRSNLKRASEKQLGFIRSLLDEREMSDDARSKAVAQLDTLDVSRASKWIERLLELPKKQTTTAKRTDWPDVPAGRYAIEIDDKLHFFVVDRPTEGRWDGYTFLNEQAGSERWPVKGDRKRDVLTEIARDVRGASTRYGIEIGSCGVCGHTLTDETSRERGIGPVCADKMGW